MKVRDREDALASMRDACATQSVSHSRLFSYRNPLSPKSNLRIAPVPQSILRAGSAAICSSCKMAEQSSSSMLTADLQTSVGRSLAGQKVFGELQHSRLCERACLDSTIQYRTRSPSGKVIHGNRRSRFGNCSAKPTALKARRVFSGPRFAIGTPRQSLYPVKLNLVRLLFMVQVTSRFFQNCCAGN